MVGKNVCWNRFYGFKSLLCKHMLSTFSIQWKNQKIKKSKRSSNSLPLWLCHMLFIHWLRQLESHVQTTYQPTKHRIERPLRHNNCMAMPLILIHYMMARSTMNVLVDMNHWQSYTLLVVMTTCDVVCKSFACCVSLLYNALWNIQPKESWCMERAIDVW